MIDHRGRVLRVLIVDDSATSRVVLTRMVTGSGKAQVVGEAANGEEGLVLADAHRPDVVILDLEMPRMDGFTFLRLLMARRPTPVIVVSSNAQKADVFKALELGALDFVAKPERDTLDSIRAELMDKCNLVRALRLENLEPRRMVEREPRQLGDPIEPSRIAVIAASTGGPQAIQLLLEAVPGDLDLGILIAQHMPERFTRAFAERLGRTSRFNTREAEGGDVVAAGRVLVAPGGRNLEVARGADGVLRAVVVEPGVAAPREARYVPSADRLLTSAARTLGPRVCAVVLTGMGRDGQAGAKAVRDAGGLVLAESAESAVVPGMPEAAIGAGAVHEVLPLAGLARRLTRFGREPRR
ncbi:MAG TPA: chemotaxis-specific protein-glutamate methyltransferase CheB [Anaeromyxobacteraceae bacterium]|nr:chemotaxis-specific protein-glutamate methyltransferase CheB [Anaeromyxobacteraceae bacterium]